MDQYTVRNGEGSTATKIVVWGQRDDLHERRALRDALMREPHLVTDCTVEQDRVGCDPFIGTVYFAPQAREHRKVQQLRIATTDARVLSGLRTLFDAIQEGQFSRVGVEAQAEAVDFINFTIFFYKAGATVSS